MRFSFLRLFLLLAVVAAAFAAWRYAFAPVMANVAEARRGAVAEAVYATGVVGGSSTSAIAKASR